MKQICVYGIPIHFTVNVPVVTDMNLIPCRHPGNLKKGCRRFERDKTVEHSSFDEKTVCWTKVGAHEVTVLREGGRCVLDSDELDQVIDPRLRIFIG